MTRDHHHAHSSEPALTRCQIASVVICVVSLLIILTIIMFLRWKIKQKIKSVKEKIAAGRLSMQLEYPEESPPLGVGEEWPLTLTDITRGTHIDQ